LLKTVTLTPALESFRFAVAGREATIETAVRVGSGGRIVGFGDRARVDGTEVLPLFPSGGGTVDERVLGLVCRRGLALALGPWTILRPRVVVRGVEGVQISREAFTRALQAAGALTVEFTD
jgi:hypothetical protein